MIRNIFFFSAALSTILSSLFLTTGFWIGISPVLIPVAIGLEISKIALFLEIKRTQGFQRFLVTFISVILSITSISASKFQMETLVKNQNEMHRQESLSHKNAQVKTAKLLKAIDLKEKAIAKDLEHNFRSRALQSQKDLEKMISDLSSDFKVKSEVAVKISSHYFWALAAILDVVIFSLLFLVKTPLEKRVGQQEPKKHTPTTKRKTPNNTKGVETNLATHVRQAIIRSGSTRAKVIQSELGISMQKVCAGFKLLAEDGFLLKEGRSYKVVNI